MLPLRMLSFFHSDYRFLSRCSLISIYFSLRYAFLSFIIFLTPGLLFRGFGAIFDGADCFRLLLFRLMMPIITTFLFSRFLHVSDIDASLRRLLLFALFHFRCSWCSFFFSDFISWCSSLFSFRNIFFLSFRNISFSFLWFISLLRHFEVDFLSLLLIYYIDFLLIFFHYYFRCFHYWLGFVFDIWLFRLRFIFDLAISCVETFYFRFIVRYFLRHGFCFHWYFFFIFSYSFMCLMFWFPSLHYFLSMWRDFASRHFDDLVIISLDYFSDLIFMLISSLYFSIFSHSSNADFHSLIISIISFDFPLLMRRRSFYCFEDYHQPRAFLLSHYFLSM